MGKMLFNVAKDPYEKTDVTKEHPEVVKRLAARLKKVGATRPPLGDKPLLM
jgi:hypothetical protein